MTDEQHRTPSDVDNVPVRPTDVPVEEGDDPGDDEIVTSVDDEDNEDA